MIGNSKHQLIPPYQPVGTGHAHEGPRLVRLMPVRTADAGIAPKFPGDGAGGSMQSSANLSQAQSVEYQMIDNITFMKRKMDIGHSGSPWHLDLNNPNAITGPAVSAELRPMHCLNVLQRVLHLEVGFTKYAFG